MAWAEVGKVSIFISGSIQTNPEKMSLSCNPDIKQAFAQALTQVCSESPPQAISPAPTKTYHLHQHSSHLTKTVPGSLGPGGCGFSPQALVLCGPSSLLLLLLFFFFLLFRAALAVYRGSQARGRFRTAVASLHHSLSNTRSEPRLRPTPQLTATLDLNPLSEVRESNLHPHGYQSSPKPTELQWELPGQALFLKTLKAASESHRGCRQIHLHRR